MSRWEDLPSTGAARTVTDLESIIARSALIWSAIHGSGDWDGISCWSSSHPSITLVATWHHTGIAHLDTTALATDHPATVDAAALIVRSVHRR